MKPLATYQKLRGGYYTPQLIANFLADWAIRTAATSVLEPSCGDGVFLVAAAKTLMKRGTNIHSVPNLLVGVEVDEQEITKSQTLLENLGLTPGPGTLVKDDFFKYCRSLLFEMQFFDAVIGNPPFIRYQNFPEEQREIAFGLMRSAGLHPNRLTNVWLPFVVASSLVLKKHGRLGMVIPAELLQVNYAAELRSFLTNYYSKITLITFKKLLFDNVQQEVVLLLGERNGKERIGIRTIELDDINSLHTYEHTEFSNHELKPMDHSTEKWTQYFLDSNEILLLRNLRRHPKLISAGKVISVDVGVVTGQNEFFVLKDEQVKEHSLAPYTLPIVCRSGHLKGLFFTREHWLSNVEKQYRAFLLSPANIPFEQLPEALRKYVEYGESRGFHKGYKCSIREPWYVVPSIWVPDAFILRQVHHYPKIVLNEAGTTCTDTIHRVKFLNNADAASVVSAFLNSLTLAFSEVTGRSYGGGILELEPREAERLPLPIEGTERLDITLLDKILEQDGIDTLLDITDEILLREGLGIGAKDVTILRRIWRKMCNRRIGRNHKKSM